MGTIRVGGATGFVRVSWHMFFPFPVPYDVGDTEDMCYDMALAKMYMMSLPHPLSSPHFESIILPDALTLPNTRAVFLPAALQALWSQPGQRMFVLLMSRTTKYQEPGGRAWWRLCIRESFTPSLTYS